MAAEFIVQDVDSPTDDANAYIEVEFFEQYCLDRGYTYTATDEEIQVAIVKATDYIDARWKFKGQRKQSYQSTECPRARVFSPTTGHYIDDLPLRFKEACAEYAFLALTQSLMPNPSQDASGRVVVEVEKTLPDGIGQRYKYGGGGTAYLWPQYPLADRKMRSTEMLTSGGGIVRG